MIDAARRRKARAKAGCAQAKTYKSVLTHGEHSTIREWTRGVQVLCSPADNVRPLVEVKDDQRVGFEPGLRPLRPAGNQLSVRWLQITAAR